MNSAHQMHRLSASARSSDHSIRENGTDGLSAHISQPCPCRQAAPTPNSCYLCSRNSKTLQSNESASLVQQAFVDSQPAQQIDHPPRTSLQRDESADHVIDIQDTCESSDLKSDDRSTKRLSTASQSTRSIHQAPQGVTKEKADWEPWT